MALQSKILFPEQVSLLTKMLPPEPFALVLFLKLQFLCFRLIVLVISVVMVLSLIPTIRLLIYVHVFYACVLCGL